MKYLAAILGVIATAGIGSCLTNQGLDWYLNQSIVPSFAPSGAVIGGVWTVIYALSAVALILWLSQKKRDANYPRVVWWFVINGFLNAYWSYLFFAQHQVEWAIAEMIGLEISVLVLIWLMWKQRRWSAILLLPYAAWVAFATYLAYSFWILNK
ncbi:MAG: TspO/MBR family protein [Patescibacteria group bacterium]